MAKDIRKQSQSKIRSKVRWGTSVLLLLLVICGAYVAPAYYNSVAGTISNTTGLGIPQLNNEPFRLGLDLQGGAHLIYQAEISEIASSEQATAVEGVRDVIERRVAGIGVGEPNVQTNRVGEDYRIIVELPGVTDIKEAIGMIGETPILEFKEPNTVPSRELTPEEQIQIDAYNADAKQRAESLLKEIQKGASFEDVARTSTEDSATKEKGGYLGFIGKNSQYFQYYIWGASSAEGDISQTVYDGEDGYNILKRGAVREGESEIEASHILICYVGSAGCEAPQFTKDEALQKAEELYKEANADNFADLAKENSEDLGSASLGGKLPPVTKGMMVPAFEEALMKAQAGEIIGPVETQFGYHIIYKEAEAPSQEYELWRILVKKQTELDVLGPQDQWMKTDLSGKQLDRSEVVTDSNTGAVQVALNFDKEGTELFRDITERNVGRPVAIFLDGQPISTPTVNQPIRDGKAVISGSFNIQEAKLLSQRLNAGALPVPVDLISQQAIGATLGAQSLSKSLYAGIVAVVIVMFFMILYYRLPGILSVVALLLYIALTLALFKLIGVTLTLAGIAGLVLSIGMAVDANVLIFERIKEELQEGKSLKTSIEEGFIRAWSSIRDGNVSTLLTCFILMGFGTSFVKGFAITLSLGVLVSLFSAITVTKTFLRFVNPWFKDANWLFLGSKKK